MKLRRVCSLAAVCLLVGGLGVGYGQSRTERGSDSFPVVGLLIGSCGDFEIWSDFVVTMSWMNRYDRSGQWMQQNLRIRIGPRVYYNASNPEKVVAGGPSELANERWDPATGIVKGTGPTNKVHVPGYGNIFSENGSYTWQCEPVTFANCQLVRNVGPNQFAEQDLAELCDYLR